MLSDFLQGTFYGNTLGDWLISFGIVIVSLVLGKALYWVFSKIVKAYTSRTKTRLDDIIVDKVEEPVVFAFIIGGIWFALSLLTKGEGLETFIGKVYFMLIVFNITWMLVRLFDALVEEYLVPAVTKSESSLDDQLLPIFRKSSKYAMWAIAAILALNNAGYDVGALLAGLGIGGLAFALAAQDLIKNLFGGFTIFVDKPFMVGDRVNVAGFDGFVEEIGIRSLRIRTLAGRQVVIPNSNVANDSIENITSEPSRKVVMNLGLTYDTTPEQMQLALDLLGKIISNNSSIELEKPNPALGANQEFKKRYMAYFKNFGAFSLDILFIYFIRPGEDFLAVESAINFEVLRLFNENKLNFAFPTQTIISQQA